MRNHGHEDGRVERVSCNGKNGEKDENGDVKHPEYGANVSEDGVC